MKPTLQDLRDAVTNTCLAEDDAELFDDVDPSRATGENLRAARAARRNAVRHYLDADRAIRFGDLT